MSKVEIGSDINNKKIIFAFPKLSSQYNKVCKENKEKLNPTCGYCRKKKNKISWCSGCGWKAYCCKEHQIADWKNHKRECKEIQHNKKDRDMIRRIMFSVNINRKKEYNPFHLKQIWYLSLDDKNDMVYAESFTNDQVSQLFDGEWEDISKKEYEKQIDKGCTIFIYCDNEINRLISVPSLK